MIIGFTGTQRGMTPIQKQYVEVMIRRISQNKFFETHHGDCIGADKEFHNIICKVNSKIIIHPPTYNGKRAFCHATNCEVLTKKEYIQRNHDIVNASDVILATPGEQYEVLRSGTWATIRYSKKRNKKLYIIYPDGKYETWN